MEEVSLIGSDIANSVLKRTARHVSLVGQSGRAGWPRRLQPFARDRPAAARKKVASWRLIQVLSIREQMVWFTSLDLEQPVIAAVTAVIGAVPRLSCRSGANDATATCMFEPIELWG